MSSTMAQMQSQMGAMQAENLQLRGEVEHLRNRPPMGAQATPVTQRVDMPAEVVGALLELPLR